MNIKLWKIICFLVVIVAATIVVHPTQRDILRSYIENGRYAKAWNMIEALLKKSPLDMSLNSEASRLDLLEGRPDKAIDRLESLAKHTSLQTDQLEQLAKLYEWGRQPQKALNTWERLLKKDPDSRMALAKLIGYYRYQGDLTRECRTIVRLIHLQEADGMWQKHGKRLSNLIADQLSRLDVPAEPEPVPPLTAMLGSGLYQIYEKEISETKADTPFVTENIFRCLEQFVWTGHLALGRAFADRTDSLWQTGIDQQLRLVEVLQWSRMDKEALDLLTRLHNKAPEDSRVLMAMAQIADHMSDPAAGIALYEALVHLNPDNPVYRQRLTALKLQTGQAAKLFDDYEKRYAETKNPNLIHEMLELAMPSGEPDLQMRALRFAEQAGADDMRSLKLRADLYLTLDQPENAYPLLKRLATGHGGKTADYESLIRVAGYTDNPAIIIDALSMAERMRPDDPTLLGRVAGGWLNANRPQDAYRTMRHLTALNGNRSADIHRTLDMAWHTGEPQTIEESAAWALDLSPDDPKVIDEVIRLYLSVNQTEKAYALKAEQIRRQKDASQIATLISLAEATGRLENVGEALDMGLQLAPQNTDLLRRLAEYHLARSNEPEAITAFERYLQKRPEDRKARRQLAQLYEWQNQPEKAIAIYRQLVRENPKDSFAAQALDRLTGKSVVPEESLAQMKKQADADPKNIDLALAVGRTLVAEGQLEEGAVYLQRAAELAPENTDIWLELADVYEATDQTDRLIDVLSRVAKSDSLDRRRTLLLADAYLTRRHWSEAAALLKPLMDDTVLPRREGLMLIDAYTQMGRHNEAIRLIRRLKAENGSDPEFLASLGQQAQWGRQLDLALDIYETVLRQKPKNLKALKGMGQVYAWTGRPERAIRSLKTYNRLFPEDHETWYLLGETYLAVHRDAEAQKAFHAAKRLIDAAKTKNGPTAEPSIRKGAWP